MALISLPGDRRAFIGPDPWNTTLTTPSASSNTTLNAAAAAITFIGHMVTSDGASHTINTTGSSSIGWRSGPNTFASGSTIVKVGIGAIDTTTGPSARAVNAAGVITFDVNASFTGPTGITSAAWNTSVPTAGTKTIANGDLVAISIQMTARGGTDSILVVTPTQATQGQRPTATTFSASTYAAATVIPNVLVTFADGAIGWLAGSQIGSTFNTRAFNSGSSPNEYGQLFQLPFPAAIQGIYGWVAPAADFDVVLYSDPLGTPAASKTISVDANTVTVATGRRFEVAFPAPYIVAPNQPIVAALKPANVTGITVYYKTLALATHRVVDPWGTSGYGVQRASGAFGNANASLDHYYIGMIAGAFEHGVMPTYGPGII